MEQLLVALDVDTVAEARVLPESLRHSYGKLRAAWG